MTDDRRVSDIDDVGREDMTNETGMPSAAESLREDMAEETPQGLREAELQAEAGSSDKEVMARAPELTDDELARLSILAPGTPLEQGSVYLDLNQRGRGSFRAIGGQVADRSQKLIAKSMTDYELWNALTGGDDPILERPK